MTEDSIVKCVDSEKGLSGIAVEFCGPGGFGKGEEVWI